MKIYKSINDYKEKSRFSLLNTLTEAVTIELANGTIVQLSDEEAQGLLGHMAGAPDFSVATKKKVLDAVGRQLPIAIVRGKAGQSIADDLPEDSGLSRTDVIGLEAITYGDLYNAAPTTSSGGISRSAKNLRKLLATNGYDGRVTPALIDVLKQGLRSANTSEIEGPTGARSIMPDMEEFLDSLEGRSSGDISSSIMGTGPVKDWVESLSDSFSKRLETRGDPYANKVTMLFQQTGEILSILNRQLAAAFLAETYVENKGDENAAALLDAIYSVPYSQLTGGEEVQVPPALVDIAEIGGKFGGANVGKGELALLILFAKEDGTSSADPGGGANTKFDVVLDNVQYHVKAVSGGSSARIGNLGVAGEMLKNLHALKAQFPEAGFTDKFRPGEIADSNWTAMSKLGQPFWDIVNNYVPKPKGYTDSKEALLAAQSFLDEALSEFTEGSGGVIFYQEDNKSFQLVRDEDLHVDGISNGSLKIANPNRLSQDIAQTGRLPTLAAVNEAASNLGSKLFEWAIR